MFGTKDKEQDQRAQADAYSKVLEDMARAEEERLRAEHPGLLAEFENENRRQAEGFAFTLKRHGDFLTLFLSRTANKETEWSPARKSHTETINLSKVRSIKLRSGRAADTDGEFGWSVSTRYEDEDGNWKGSGSSSGRPLGPPSGGRHVMSPAGNASYVPAQRDFLQWEEKADRDRGMVHYMDMSGGCNYRTTGFPRQSEDDRLIFRGLGLTVFAPFGQGQALLDAVLAEIAQGTSPREG